MKRLTLALSLFLVQPCYGADIGVLTEAVNKLCPIMGLSGDAKNPASLRIDFAPDATDAQKEAARQYLSTADPEAPQLQKPDLQGFLEAIAADTTFTVTDYTTAVTLAQIQDPVAKSQRIAQYVQLQSDPQRQAALLRYATKYFIPLPPLVQHSP